MYLIKHNGTKVTEVKEYPGAKVIRHDAKKSFTLDSLDGLAAKLKKLAISPQDQPPTEEEKARAEAAKQVFDSATLTQQENCALAIKLPPEKQDALVAALTQLVEE